MNSREAHDVQRAAAVKECLDTNIIDPEGCDATKDTHDPFRLLNSDLNPIETQTTAHKVVKNVHIASDTSFVDCGPRLNVLTPEPSPEMADIFGTGAPQAYKSPYNFVKLLITPAEEKTLDWEDQSTRRVSQVGSNSRNTLDFDPSSRSQDSHAIISAEGSISPSSDDEVVFLEKPKQPVLPDLVVMSRRKNLDITADWSLFNALLDVAGAAMQDPMDDMTMEKLEAAGVLLKLETQGLNLCSKNRHRESIETGLRGILKQKAPITPASKSRDEIIQKMQEQFRRSGIKPTTALGAVPGAPSSATEHLFTPDSTFRPHKNLPDSPPTSIEEEEEAVEYDSDRTIPDLNWPQSESDSEMFAAKKKKTGKQVHFQYNGPPPFLLDSGREDPVAVAAKTNVSGNLNDLPSILGQSKYRSPYQSHSNGPPIMNNSDITYPDPELASHSPTMNHSVLRETDNPSPKSDGRSIRSYYMGESDLVHPRGTSSIKPPIHNCSDDYERMREARRARDEEELYTGLKNFQGQQRGWNGERESDRSKKLTAYHEEEDRRALDVAEKNNAVRKGKEATSPCKQSLSLELDYSGMTKQEIIDAKAKDLEDAYSDISSRKLGSGLVTDMLLRENEQEIRRKMMSRHWDVDEIKREALVEQKQRAERVEKQKFKAVTALFGTKPKPSMFVRLDDDRSKGVNDSKDGPGKRKERDGDEEVTEGEVKRARKE